MITLENYCERYAPLRMVRVSREMIESILMEDEDKKNLLIKHTNKIMHEMHEEILFDVKGEGTIFQNII
jgi:hypothetical protein